MENHFPYVFYLVRIFFPQNLSYCFVPHFPLQQNNIILIIFICKFSEENNCFVKLSLPSESHTKKTYLEHIYMLFFR